MQYAHFLEEVNKTSLMVFKNKKQKNNREKLMHLEYKTEIFSIHEAYIFVCGMVLMRSTKFPDMFIRGQTCQGRPANLAPEKCFVNPVILLLLR